MKICERLDPRAKTGIIETIVNAHSPGGWTNIAGALYESYDELRDLADSDALNVIVLFSDGRLTALTNQFPVNTVVGGGAGPWCEASTTEPASPRWGTVVACPDIAGSPCSTSTPRGPYIIDLMLNNPIINCFQADGDPYTGGGTEAENLVLEVPTSWQPRGLLEVEKEVLHTAEIFDVKLGDSLDMTSILQQAQVRLLHASLSVAVQAHQAEERASQLESSNQQWRTKAQTDQLTGIANRASFDEALAQCLVRRMNGRVPGVLGLLLIDVDRFKRFNDTHGHLAGDEVLKAVGKAMESVCRESELPARYGGEEFCVLMPSAKPVAVKTLAERVRKKIEETAVEFEGKTLRMTVSIGGAIVESVSSQADGQALIKAADERLYQAKQNGRNRCEV